jgi:glycosyltransferase involved in cell wall biosynthesis
MIAIVHDWLLNLRGGEKVLDTVLSLFKEEKVRLFSFFFKKGTTTPLIDRVFCSASFLNSFPFVEKIYRYLMPFYPLAAIDLSKKLKGFDAVIQISHCFAKNVGANIPTLCYVLSPFRGFFDLKELYARGSFLKAHILDSFRKVDQALTDKSKYYVAISNFVASRFFRAYGFHPQEVLYPPVDLSSVPLRKEPFTRGTFYLTGGALTENKNFDLVIKVFNKLGLPLIVFGKGPLEGYLKSISKNNIKFLGYVSDEELHKLFCNSKAYVFLSIEDFGLSTCEYVASGGPVIGLQNSGTAEIINDDPDRANWNGFLVKCEDPSEIIEACIGIITRFEKDTSLERDPLTLRKTVEKFDKSKFAVRFIELLKNLNFPALEYLA